MILYSTGCPRCIILEKKLAEKNMKYNYEDNAEIMLAKGMTTAPMLEVDGKLLDFARAIEYINSQP